MSDTNRSQLYYAEEVTWGTIPAIALTRMRFTGESMGFAKTSTTSNEVRDDRQISDLVQNGAESVGGVNIELSYGSYDPFLVALFQAVDWVTTNVSGTDISASDVDNSLNSTTTDFTAAGGVVPGQWFLIGGFTGGAVANNTYAQAVTVTATKIVTTGITLITATAGDTVTLTGDTITNGVTEHSFVMEKAFADITKFISFTGMMANTARIDVTARSIVTGSIGFVGKTSAIASATVGTGAANAATTTRVMNSINHITSIREGGDLFPGVGNTDYVKSLSLDINNNLVGKDGVGYLENVDIRSGEADFKGSLSAYFESETIYNKYVQDSESSLSFMMLDPDNAANRYIVTLPRIKYGKGDVMIGGKNDDVLISAEYQALMHATYGFTAQINRFTA